MTLLFATEKVAEDWATGPLHRTLRRVVQDLGDWAESEQNANLTVTCLLRTPQENDAIYGGHGDHLMGVHVVGRGADIRTRDLPDDLAIKLSARANQLWSYNPASNRYVVAMIEFPQTCGSTGEHLHVQVSDATVERFDTVEA